MMKVSIKNFQSLVDCELSIEGLTTLFGPNNTGKSAVIRAIYAVFTNPPYLNYANDLKKPIEVRLWSDDFDIEWVKTKTFNSYKINGVSYNKVGSDLPPQLKEIGIDFVEIGGKKFYPQFAAQLIGQLFLIDLPGSYLAEAVSDTDTIQVLTEAFKLSEKNRKSAASELKVRTKDLEEVDLTISKYSELESIKIDLNVVVSLDKDLSVLREHLNTLKMIKDRKSFYLSTFKSLDNLDYLTTLLTQCDIRSLLQSFEKLQVFRSILTAYNSLLKTSDSVTELLTDIDIPIDMSDLRVLYTKALELTKLLNSIYLIKTTLVKVERVIVSDSDTSQSDLESLKKTYAMMNFVSQARANLLDLNATISNCSESIETISMDVSKVKQNISRILEECGKCPVCFE